MSGKYSAGSLRSYLNLVLRHGRDFGKAFGISLIGIIRPFGTKPNPSGVPSYQPYYLPSGIAPDGGRFGATASGLNPFGPATQHQGIISGSGTSRNRDLNTDIVRDDVRAFGVKTPMTAVGWAYDIFGYPAPNSSSGWNVFRGTGLIGSGAFGTAMPSGTFKISATGAHEHGAYVPEPLYKAGPVDLRWDEYRGVFAANVSVHSAYVLRPYITGLPVTTNNTPVISTGITYDIRIFDGVANQMTLTGIAHVGPRPINNAYKVYPASSGDFCLLVHCRGSGDIPRFGALVFEMPGVTQCASTGVVDDGGDDGGNGNNNIYSGPEDGDPFASTGLLTGTEFAEGLASYPISPAYGGIGFNTIASGDILIGGTGNNFLKRRLVAGSGLELSFPNTTQAVLSIATGTIFVATGSPLGLAYGGTGASGRNFVAVTGNEVIQGSKQFYGTVRVPMGGSSGNLGLAFVSTGGTLIHAGIFVNSGTHAVSFYNSGILGYEMAITGHIFRQRLVINNTIADTNDPVIIVQQNLPVLSASSGELISFRRHDGGIVGGFTPSGASYSRYINIVNSGIKKFELGPSGDAMYFGLNTSGSTGSGYILAIAASGASTGGINISAATGLSGGNIITAYGGGTIDTNSGYIQLGLSSHRHTLVIPTGVTPGAYQTFLPTGGNLVSREQLGVYLTVTGSPDGYTGELDLGSHVLVISGGIIRTVSVPP